MLNAQQSVSLNVFFETDDFHLLPSELNKLKTFLQKFDTVNILKISGVAFCDDRGDVLYNNTLSENRASEIKKIILSINGNSSVIPEIQGKGELELQNKEDTAKQRSFNRRAELLVEFNFKQKKIIQPQQHLSENNSLLSDTMKVGDKITLDNILFIGGRHILLPESYSSLNKLVYTLKEKKRYTIIILGHVCCMPKGYDGQDFDTGRHDLSIERAKTIRDYLVENGVDSTRLAYKGLKSDFPTGKGDKYDRRVEVEITGIK